MQKHVLRGGGLIVLLIAALLSAACGGSTAPTPPGYSCMTGNYCATYVRFQGSDYSGSPSINGAYTYVQNTPMTCTGACLSGPNQGYVARVLMLLSDDNNSWVESGIWNSGGVMGGTTKLFYGVGTGGVPTYHAAPISSSYNSSDYGVGIEIQRYFVSGSNYGFAFRDVPWHGGAQPAVVPPAVQVSTPNADGLSAPSAALTHVEFGEFLRGTSGATADDGNIDPPLVTSTLSGSASLPPIPAGYPNALYPYALHSGQTFPFAFYHSSESLNSDAPPIATGSPPFGAFLYFSSGAFHWSANTSSDPASNLIFFTCCGGSFQ
jgi:hypothetical protein